MLNAQRLQYLETLPETELTNRIASIKQERKNDLCLLAHHYQRRKITQLADFVGDSYGLSVNASTFEGGKYIVFAGVRFMAESAAILCRSDQIVLHPDPEAGCPMADMASISEVNRAWTYLQGLQKVIPVTYMNSTADLKSFCGKQGGTICTSSNALRTFEWAFTQGEKIFFFPDEHLGRNTALKFGIPPDEIAIWDPEKKDGGDPDSYQEAKVILWRGYCPVHMKFTVRDIEHVRRFYPKAQVIVHPECTAEVVQKADAVGSTEFIKNLIENSKPGDEFFIGTEMNLVQNLQARFPDRLIAKLHRSLCLTMYQITMGRLLYAIENLEGFEKVQVDEATKHFALIALNRMLSLKGSATG